MNGCAFMVKVKMLLVLSILVCVHSSVQWNNSLQIAYDAVFLDKLQNVKDSIPICIPDGSNITNFDELGQHVIVKLNLILYQLISLNEREQTVVLNLGVSLNWHDCRLEWNKDNYRNLTQIRTSVNRKDGVSIFIPEIQLIEGRSDVNFEFNQDADLIIYNDGFVILEKTVTRDVLCNIDVSMYPFDVQTCSVSLISAFYPVDCLNITTPQSSKKDIAVAYTPSDTWDLLKMNRSWKATRAMNENYATMVYIIKWRRRPTYELVNLLVPAMLTALISSFIFTTPSGSIDKIGLNLTILLSLFVFTQLMYDKMPETGSTIPLLSQYFMICIGLIAVSCIFSVVSVSVASRRSKTMPQLMKKLAMLLGPLFAPAIFKKVKKAVEERDRKASQMESRNEQLEPIDEDDSVETRQWLLLATIFDRTFFVIHMTTTLGTLFFYLANGFSSWSKEKDDFTD